MFLSKSLDRVRRMHSLIKFHRTGTPKEFAERLGISRSMMFRLLNELKQMGAPIYFCSARQSYAYYASVELQIGFVPVPKREAVADETKSARTRVVALEANRPVNYQTAGL